LGGADTTPFVATAGAASQSDNGSAEFSLADWLRKLDDVAKQEAAAQQEIDTYAATIKVSPLSPLDRAQFKVSAWLDMYRAKKQPVDVLTAAIQAAEAAGDSTALDGDSQALANAARLKQLQDALLYEKGTLEGLGILKYVLPNGPELEDDINVQL